MPPTKRKQLNCSPISCISDCTVDLSTASNDLEECVSNFKVKAMSDKIEWTPEMDEHFIDAYIAFKNMHKWDKRKTLEWNFSQIAEHLREKHSIEVTGPQCQSRFYRFKKKWHVFSKLRGMSNKSDTGIGWEEDTQNFTATDKHWDALEAQNKDYASFKAPFSSVLYERITPVIFGETATGSHAQSAGQPVPPPQCRSRAASKPRKNRKGTGVGASSSQLPASSCPWEADDVYYVSADPELVSGKRPASGFTTSCDQEGSRGSKRSKSSGDRTEDALSKISNFSEVALVDRRARMEREEMYGVEKCQDIVEAMEIPDDWKLEVNSYLAKESSFGQRILFLRYDETKRYAYILKHMQKTGGI